MTGRGILIALEGIDGAGKTTQVQMLAEALQSAGVEVLTSKEPTDGEWGRKIRASADTGRLSFEEELEAFIKDRQEHLEKKVLPALSKGQIVILDRYFYSTIAYQGVRSQDVAALDKEVRALAHTPDMVFVLDVDPKLSLLRIASRVGGANEFEKLEDLISIRTVFDYLCTIDPVIWKIDGSMSLKAVHDTIISLLVENALKKWCAKDYGCEDPYYCSFRMTNSCRWWDLRTKLLPREGINTPALISAPPST